MSKLAETISELVARRKEQHEVVERHGGSHPDAPAVWAELTRLLSEDSGNTCEFLGGCDRDSIYWLSEVFDNVSECLQSWEFIDCIEQLQQKFPSVNMQVDIEYAIKAMKMERD